MRAELARFWGLRAATCQGSITTGYVHYSILMAKYHELETSYNEKFRTFHPDPEMHTFRGRIQHLWRPKNKRHHSYHPKIHRNATEKSGKTMKHNPSTSPLVTYIYNHPYIYIYIRIYIYISPIIYPMPYHLGLEFQP